MTVEGGGEGGGGVGEGEGGGVSGDLTGSGCGVRYLVLTVSACLGCPEFSRAETTSDQPASSVTFNHSCRSEETAATIISLSADTYMWRVLY